MTKHLFKKGNQINKGRTPWNKGINQWEGKEHPRGMLGKKPWNKGLKGLPNVGFKKGNKLWEKRKTHGCPSGVKNAGQFKKGNIPKAPFKKGQKSWNYIDGRSKFVSPARYGDDWEVIRYLIYLRDCFTCQRCGLKMTEETGTHHVHHKIPFLISFDNSFENLVTLCSSCHKKEEAVIMKQLKINREIEK